MIQKEKRNKLKKSLHHCGHPHRPSPGAEPLVRLTTVPLCVLPEMVPVYELILKVNHANQLSYSLQYVAIQFFKCHSPAITECNNLASQAYISMTHALLVVSQVLLLIVKNKV